MPSKKKKAPPRLKSTETKAEPPPKLSKTEEDLVRHMSQGYQLETSSLWDNPILRNLEDNTEVRTNANRGTIEALQRRRLIAVVREGGVMKPTIWRLASKAEVRNDTGRT